MKGDIVIATWLIEGTKWLARVEKAEKCISMSTIVPSTRIRRTYQDARVQMLRITVSERMSLHRKRITLQVVPELHIVDGVIQCVEKHEGAVSCERVGSVGHQGHGQR